MSTPSWPSTGRSSLAAKANMVEPGRWTSAACLSSTERSASKKGNLSVAGGQMVVENQGSLIEHRGRHNGIEIGHSAAAAPGEVDSHRCQITHRQHRAACSSANAGHAEHHQRLGMVTESQGGGCVGTSRRAAGRLQLLFFHQRHRRGLQPGDHRLAVSATPGRAARRCRGPAWSPHKLERLGPRRAAMA